MEQIIKLLKEIEDSVENLISDARQEGYDKGL